MIETSFVDTNESDSEMAGQTIFTIQEVIEAQVEADEEEREPYTMPDAILDHSYMISQPTFDGNYSSGSEKDYSEYEVFKVTKVEKKDSEKPKRHKLRQLTGKSACKYCDTVFQSKESLKMHVCEFLQCDPKNFICRICKKELSRKTFSNHLHETLDCQYCGKKFVNPRNMKTHIKKVHQGEKFIPPLSPDRAMYANFEDRDETIEPVLDEITGLMVSTKNRRKKYPRKTGRFECGKQNHRQRLTQFQQISLILDLCGRLFTTLRSLKIHMDLHTSEFEKSVSHHRS